jgi:hypothetical protein
MAKKTYLVKFGLSGLLVSLAALAGCQTSDLAGMTLPSGYYLKHPPNYFPPEPEFPLLNELTEQQAQAAQGLPGGPPLGGAPRAVPPGGQ